MQGTVLCTLYAFIYSSKQSYGIGIVKIPFQRRESKVKNFAQDCMPSGLVDPGNLIPELLLSTTILPCFLNTQILFLLNKNSGSLRKNTAVPNFTFKYYGSLNYFSKC